METDEPRDTDPTLLAAQTMASAMDRDYSELTVEAQTFPQLTSRERQVATMLALGYRNREIAADIGVSVKTVDTHRGHLLKKLNLTNNVGLARLAIREGWVSATDELDKQVDDQLSTLQENGHEAV